MINVLIDNSTCRILGLSQAQFKELRKVLSYMPDPATVQYGGGHRNKKKYLINFRCAFPTGLLYLVNGWIGRHKLEVTRKDLRGVPKPLELFPMMQLDHIPYPEQKAAAEACRRLKRGIVSMPTGTGKSVVAALIINEMKVRTLVVVPSLELKRQLTETLAKAFGAAYVGGLGSPIAVQNVDALDPHSVLTDYDCVIIDEFHHSGAKTYRTLNKKAWKNVYYKFGLTATPFRSQDHERLLLESVLSQVIYRLDYKTAVDKGYIVPVHAYYVDLPKQNVEGFTWAEVYSELVVNNLHRNKVISDFLIHLNGAQLKTLCLVKEIQHGYEICHLLKGVPFINGSDFLSRNYLDQFINDSTPVLLGTIGILGEGVDTKPAEYIIIAGLGKSKNQFMQQIGRGVRKYPGKDSCKVILFRDSSHKWPLTHFKAQVKILKDEYGIKPVKLEL